MRHLGPVPKHAKRHPGGRPSPPPCALCAKIRAAAAAIAATIKGRKP